MPTDALSPLLAALDRDATAAQEIALALVAWRRHSTPERNRALREAARNAFAAGFPVQEMVKATGTGRARWYQLLEEGAPRGTTGALGGVRNAALTPAQVLEQLGAYLASLDARGRHLRALHATAAAWRARRTPGTVAAFRAALWAADEAGLSTRQIKEVTRMDAKTIVRHRAARATSTATAPVLSARDEELVDVA